MDPQGLKTLDKETFEAPESRIIDCTSCRARIQELRAGDDERSDRRAKTQGLIDGNRPYHEGRMSQVGRGDDANINFREAEGRVAAATTPYYELCFGVPRAADIKVYWGDNKMKMQEWGEKISDAYSETLWAWKAYKINMQLSHYQMTVFGRGPILWDKKRGWHFEAKRDDSVWVADNARCDIDELSEMALPGHFEPVQLFKLIEKASDESGWNKQIAKQAIIDAAPRSLRDTFRHSWTGYQASLRRGDTLWNNRASRIYYTDYLVREFDGKISHCIVLDTPQSDRENKLDKNLGDDFLYKKERKYESFHQIINPFFFDIGPDGYWYSVKGLGPKIYDFCDLKNRTFCTLINNAVAGAGIPLKAMNAQAMQKIQQTPIVRAGGVTFIPPDWEVQQINMRGSLEGPMSVMKELDNLLESNTGQYQQLDDTPQPTLGQEQIQVSARSTLTRGAYDRYCHYLDDMHSEILRRMLDPDLSENDAGGKEALEMRKKLLDDDVPEECLMIENICYVQAKRATGYGSQQMQQVIGQRLLARIGTMSEKGRRNALRLITAAEVGQSNVDSFYEPFEEIGVPNDQEAQAGMENMLLRLPGAGVTLEVTPEMNGPIHFVSHMKNAMTAAQALQQGQLDPNMVITLLDNTGVHNHKHLETMQGDPTRKDEIKQYTKMLMMLGKMTDKLKKQLGQQQNGQGKQPQADPEMMAGFVKMMADIDLKKKKMELTHELKKEDMDFKHHMKDLDMADKMNRNRMEMMMP